MRSYLTACNLAAALSGIVLIGLARGGAAHADTSMVFRYSTPQTGHLMVAAAAFVPQTPNVLYTNNGDVLSTTGNSCFAAPVNLPQGAKMKRLAMWYSTNGPTNAFLDFSRLRPAKFIANFIARVNPVDTSGAIAVAAIDISPLVPIVNEEANAYHLLLCTQNPLVFGGARITYTYRTAGH